MADPLSFVASIIAVTSLAGNVTAKGYQYLKAVKNCPEEAKRLMVEVNILCGILGRLVVLLQSTETNSKGKPTKEKGSHVDLEAIDSEDTESIESSESDSESKITNQALEPPDFIYECQKVLDEIENILNSFGPIDNPSSNSNGKGPRLQVSKGRRLDAKDLKWPLAKSKTSQLIATLERHKTTCIIALGKHSLTAVHVVLEQTKISNRHLIELKTKQEKLLEISVTREEGM